MERTRVDTSRVIDAEDCVREQNHILLDGHGSGTDYRIEVSGRITPGEYEDPELRQQGSIGYDWVDWTVVDYYDDYYYTGRVTRFDIDNPRSVTLYHNDTVVNAADVVGRQNANHILLDGHGSGTDYRIEVSGRIMPGEYEDPELRQQGGIGYDWADWTVVDYYDDYYYTGQITRFDVYDPRSVTVYHNCLQTTPQTITTG